MFKKFLTAIVSVITTITFVAPAYAATTVVYDNIPSPVPGNVPSVGFEATSTAQFGGQLGLSGTDRTNPVITVLMSSWGCQSGTWHSQDCVTTPGATFSHPVTLNVYNVGAGNSVGSLITSKTQTFAMPYRPSADNANCTGGNAGKWFDGANCVNGKAFTIDFALTGITLPNNVIVGVAYNTSHYGASPIGVTACNATPEGCPYDALNVGTNPTPSVGTALPSVNDAYLSSTWTGAYCDNGAGGTGIFRLDAGCWTGFLPAIRVEASPLVVPDECSGMTFSNTIVGTEDDDVINGTTGKDLIFALGGKDTVKGNGSADCIVAGSGDDNVEGGAGNDVILAGLGNDTVDGVTGNDRVYGNEGDDVLNGGAGDDFVYGNEDNDKVNGGSGNDSVDGGSGDDTVEGGSGTDSANGGSGTDACHAETEQACEV